MPYKTTMVFLFVILSLLVPSLLPIAAASTYYPTINALLIDNPPDGTPIQLQCRPVKSTGTDSTYGKYFILGEDASSDTLKVYYTEIVPISGRINIVTGQISTQGADRVLCINSGPGYVSSGPVGSVQAIAAGTIAWAKTFPDGIQLPLPLNDKVVSRAFPGAGYFYIQESDSFCGIRVVDRNAALNVKSGDQISISMGQITTVDGERAIISTNSIVNGSSSTLEPVGISNRSLSGTGFNIHTYGANGRIGLNNVGLLARVWGRVTSTGTGYFLLNDGSEASSGVLVTGACSYIPQVDDFIAVNGVIGLSDGLPVVRIASDSDLESFSGTLHPINPFAISTGDGKITVYWNAVKGVTGYNVYRGLTPGMEDYVHPINGSSPIATPTYSGGNVFKFTDVGLQNYRTYYYTVKATGPAGPSKASVEVSEIPSPDAVSWDSPDPTAIINAVKSLFLDDIFDIVRIAAPDGRVCAEPQSTWNLPDGALINGSGLIKLNTGEMLPAPNDGGEFSVTQTLPVALNATDGAYRRVKSRPGYVGAIGDFYLPAADSIFIASGTRDLPYIYFGSQRDDLSININAGLRWCSRTGNWEAFQSSIFRSGLGNQKCIFNYSDLGVRNFKAGMNATVQYFILQDLAVSLLVVEGTSDQEISQTVCLINPCPINQQSCKIKRVHGMAQGGPPWNCIPTGSYIMGETAGNVQLLDQYLNTVDWTAAVTSDQGSYPASSALSWHIVTPYTDEDQINIQL